MKLETKLKIEWNKAPYSPDNRISKEVRNALFKRFEVTICNIRDTNLIADLKLEDGWVITFPQGTTKSFKPVRKGTAHIIKQYKPIVVPIVIDGFRRSFDKKGLRLKKKNILQSFIIKEPLVIDYENETIEQIVEKIEYAIEQHPSFLKVIPAEEIEEQERLNKLRKWNVDNKEIP